MDSCLKIVMVVAVSGFGLLGLFIVMLSLPKSRLASSLQLLFGIGTTAVSTLLIVSPVDLIPFLPIDDPLYVVTAIGGAVMAYLGNRDRKQLGG